MKNPNAEDCINYIENFQKIKLYDYQKEIIKHWFNGKEVATARCAGRTLLKNAVRNYLLYWTNYLDQSNHPTNPDFKYDYTYPLKENLLTEDQISIFQEIMTKEAFDREFKLDY